MQSRPVDCILMHGFDLKKLETLFGSIPHNINQVILLMQTLKYISCGPVGHGNEPVNLLPSFYPLTSK